MSAADAPQKVAAEVTGPPDTGEIARKWQLTTLQWVGVPLIMLIPLLALFGVFGISSDEIVSVENDVAVTITYPIRTRYMSGSDASIRVRNVGGSDSPPLALWVSRDYLTGFSNVQFNPRMDTISEGYYITGIGTLGPGDSRLFTVSLTPRQTGLQQGMVIVIAADEPLMELPLQTFIFP